MPKDLTDKKEKKRKEKKEATALADEPSVAAEDVNMEEGESGKVKKSKKDKKEKKDEVTVPLEELSPIAQPLAQKKLLKNLHRTIKRGTCSIW